MTKLIRWLVGVALTTLGMLLVAVPAYADSDAPPSPGGHSGTTGTIVITGLAVVLVVIVSWIALRRIAAARAVRQTATREAANVKLPSGEDRK